MSEQQTLPSLIGGTTGGVGGALIVTCALIIFICRICSATQKCALCRDNSSRRRNVIYYVRDAPREPEETRGEDSNTNKSQGETGELSAQNNQKQFEFDLKPDSALRTVPPPAYVGIGNYHNMGTQLRQTDASSTSNTNSNSHVIININSISTEV